MPRPKQGARLYTRQQGGQERYYADLRGLGGGREALIPQGDTLATTDPDIAQTLLALRIGQLKEQKSDQVILGVRRRVTLQEYAAEHLVRKAKAGKVTAHTLHVAQKQLEAAIAFLGAERDLATIGVEDIERYAHHLAERESARGGTISPGTQRKFLNTLSNLFRRAQRDGIVRGANPVAVLEEKPADEQREAPWLEVWEGALLLEAARTFPYDAQPDDSAGGRLGLAIVDRLGTGEGARAEFVRRMREAGTLATAEKLEAYLSGKRIPTRDYLLVAAEVLGVPTDQLHRGRGERSPMRPPRHMYPLIAGFLLTGARESELYGLLIGDVSQKKETVTIRRHGHRRLKTATSARTLPYWPQLQEILGPHIEQRRKDGAGERDLVFVSQRTGAMLEDIRKSLDTIAARAGWAAGAIRTKMFRHAYCSARLQTLDNGYPVAERTVADELGHGGYDLVRRTYSHLGKVRHRSEVVEYRIEQQREHIPAERLRLLLRVA